MKTKKGPTTIPQSHLHSRISYLYQAATYLAEIHQTDPASQANTSEVQDAVMNERNDSSGRIQVDTGIEASKDMTVECHDQIKSKKTAKPLISEALGPSRRLLSHLRAVSLKSQIRLTPTMKHSICQDCDSLLLRGRTSTSRLENKSRGGRKPWADVLVVTCNSCGLAKRHPIGAKRQCRRAERARKTKPVSDGVGPLHGTDDLSQVDRH